MQIGHENVHRVGAITDDIFGAANRLATVATRLPGSVRPSAATVADYLLRYNKDRKLVKYCQPQ